ncbi:MAG: tetratricopeptide repeat protein [Pseudomonadales bacterium]
MLNVFTNSLRLQTSLLLLATGLITGCAGAPVSEHEVNAATDRQERTADAQTQHAHSAIPAPSVKGRNAEDFATAVAAIKSGDLAEAERLLRRVTESQPELAGPWVNLGQVYLSLGQQEEARLAFRKAIAANPANCAAYNQLGVLSRQMGDFDAAENHYLSCLSNNPDSADIYLNLGILYELYLGRLPEALSAYRQYQVLVDEPDRKVAGWVMDLERRTRE